MLSQTQLLKNKEISDTSIKKMESIIEKLNALIEQCENDKSRSRDWILETVKATRAKEEPALTAELKTIMTMAEVSYAHKKFWENKPLLLSLQKFDEDAARDAQIRLCHASELGTISLPLLGLTFENARADRNLPLVYQCWRVGQARSTEASFTDSMNLALNDLELPGQAASLAAISACVSNRAHGEMIWQVSVSGQRGDPVRKLNVARQQQASSRMVAANYAI
ncbi:MAG: hypothetical protein DID92_2727743058 [Candidatus Nitrotoga sp. SPKER]|nr:MAG: hypothetical protein DID92_2727743058 [Candidatus Nitrotoga sp. SPKER]